MRFSSSASSSSWRSGWLASSAALHFSSSSNSRSSSGILDLLAVLVEALQALLDHHQVAQDQLGLDVFQVAQRIDRALLVGHGLVREQAQHVREGVHHAQAGQVAGVAQVLLRDGRHVHVFHGGVRDSWAARRAAPARPGARRARVATPVRAAVEPMRVSWWTPVRIVNREVLPTMGRPIMAVFI